jgi:hypothetical protein
MILRATLVALATLLPIAAQDTPGPTSEPALPSLDGPRTKITPAHRKSVEAGLTWLAEHQQTDGSWSSRIGRKLNNGYDFTADTGHVGVTSLACIAFLAGGHQLGRGDYGDVLERGLNFVLASAQEDGYITRGKTRMYSHAFATLFLAEIYGMTHREDVRIKLQKAVDFIVSCQNEEGGWRYVPFESQSDMSIVVCQVIALRAARNIGIRVPKETVERASAYVRDSAISDREASSTSHFGGQNLIGSFKYQKEGATRSSFALTAAGVTALNGLGIYSDKRIKEGLDYLRRYFDSFTAQYGVRERGHYFFWYGNYYGVQAMYMAGEPYWTPYFTSLRDTLLALQAKDGSFPNEVGPGTAFGTAMGVLILEIPYRFLPIFQR